MMDVFITVLISVVFVISLLLIGLILIQQSKGGGLGGSFGGVGESIFGAGMANHLTKFTVWLSAAFLLLTLVLAVIIGNRGQTRSLVDQQAAAVIEEAPASPAPTAGKPAAATATGG